ncbi:hypothetical protein BRCON_0167 [Candidatus Sumerlaea chitinivorans]|uniref:Uncharacterized protein n=1 Tax=Sumerlaea chitinivorans TaxID=2250252 RepID=A0A2Z4Y1N9_SUMC1|nr:hypothetical protein BRCON_0167 [Candidatus Sumerlaea chitinivorans]
MHERTYGQGQPPLERIWIPVCVLRARWGFAAGRLMANDVTCKACLALCNSFAPWCEPV